MKDAKKRYKAKIKTVRVELYPTDEDIKNRLENRLQAGEPKATYIKRLIREDMQRKSYEAIVELSYKAGTKTERFEFGVVGDSFDKVKKDAFNNIGVICKCNNIPECELYGCVTFAKDDEYIDSDEIRVKWDGEKVCS